LTGSFIATVNADMKVGGVAETVTVTGEAPTVDVASTRNQQVISGQTVAEIPSSRQYSAFTHLIPAINVQQNDFEGSNPALYSVFQIHGGRRNEGQVLVDGMNGGYQGMGVSGYVPEVGNSQEVVFSLSGGLGEATTGGPQMNLVGKQGGNRFAGTFFVSGTGSAFQGNNLTSDVQARGLTAANSIQKLWEVNPSLGGPIVRDRLWFFGTYRYQISRQNVASMFVNRNAGDPTKWTYDPDTSQQAVDDGTWKQGNLRLTVIDHVGAVLQDQRAVRFLAWKDRCQEFVRFSSSMAPRKPTPGLCAIRAWARLGPSHLIGRAATTTSTPGSE